MANGCFIHLNLLMIVGPFVHWLAVGIVRFDKREKLSDKREKLTKLIFVSY